MGNLTDSISFAMSQGGFYNNDEIFKRPTYSDGTLVRVGDWVLDRRGNGFVVNHINAFLEKDPLDPEPVVRTTLASGHGYSLCLNSGETAKRASEDQMKTYFKKWPGEKREDPSFKYTVIMPPMHPLPHANLDSKDWPLKVVEEAAEVYSAWEQLQELINTACTWPDDCTFEDTLVKGINALEAECADVIQTAVNIFWAAEKEKRNYILGTGSSMTSANMTPVIQAMEQKNKKRGRYDGIIKTKKEYKK